MACHETGEKYLSVCIYLLWSTNNGTCRILRKIVHKGTIQLQEAEQLREISSGVLKMKTNDYKYNPCYYAFSN